MTDASKVPTARRAPRLVRFGAIIGLAALAACSPRTETGRAMKLPEHLDLEFADAGQQAFLGAHPIGSPIGPAVEHAGIDFHRRCSWTVRHHPRALVRPGLTDADRDLDRRRMQRLERGQARWEAGPAELEQGTRYHYFARDQFIAHAILRLTEREGRLVAVHAWHGGWRADHCEATTEPAAVRPAAHP